mmetsp:Transcript_797/g.1240  ORF Transcript_797/g.1240 Transcript_797/m.1240 type:complete len:281 (-) Transcript_797:204-1046(-)
MHFFVPIWHISVCDVVTKYLPGSAMNSVCSSNKVSIHSCTTLLIWFSRIMLSPGNPPPISTTLSVSIPLRFAFSKTFLTCVNAPLYASADEHPLPTWKDTPSIYIFLFFASSSTASNSFDSGFNPNFFPNWHNDVESSTRIRMNIFASAYSSFTLISSSTESTTSHFTFCCFATLIAPLVLHGFAYMIFSICVDGSKIVSLMSFSSDVFDSVDSDDSDDMDSDSTIPCCCCSFLVTSTFSRFPCWTFFTILISAGDAQSKYAPDFANIFRICGFGLHFTA